jgi:RNA polymerase sigma factor (sigma-70 family)
MEASALKYSAGIGLHGRSPLLRLQSDERLIAVLRKGNIAAFEILVSRYESRLLAFCRHLLGSREDAEDVMQEVMTAAFNAILADNRPINVRPWLYRIARNRSLNHMRRVQTIGVDSMDLHYSDHGASTADKVGEREEFRLLVGDIRELPESQKTALVLREMDALSYEQIAEAMETTVPSVKSLLVRARVSLAEAAEARLLSCGDVRTQLGEVAEGLRRRPDALVRRHLRACERCSIFRGQLKQTNRALAALMPIGPFVLIKKLALLHLGHSAGAGSGAAGAGAAGASSGAAGAGVAGAGAAGAGASAAGAAAASSGGFVSAGLGALATKAAAGIAAAAIVTAGAVEATPSSTRAHHHSAYTAIATYGAAPAEQAAVVPVQSHAQRRSSTPVGHKTPAARPKPAAAHATPAAALSTPTDPSKPAPTTTATPVNTKPAPAGRDSTQSDPTVMPPSALGPSSGQTAPSAPPTTTAPTQTTTDPTTTTTTTTTTTDPSTPVTTVTTVTPVDPVAPVTSVAPLVPITSPPSQPPTATGPTDPNGPSNPTDPPPGNGSGTTPPPSDPGGLTGSGPQSPTPPATGAGGG